MKGSPLSNRTGSARGSCRRIAKMTTLKWSCHLILKAGALAISALCLAQASAAAHHYPDRPIHLVVPYPAGGGADHWGRLVAARLAEQLGQPIIVDNVPGKGGNDGTALAAYASTGTCL